MTIYGSDVLWTMKALHALGHPITPAQWDELRADYAHGLTVEEATERIAS